MSLQRISNKNPLQTLRIFSKLDMINLSLEVLWFIHRGYYTVARRYEFYVRVARTISHSFAWLTREILKNPQVRSQDKDIQSAPRVDKRENAKLQFLLLFNCSKMRLIS